MIWRIIQIAEDEIIHQGLEAEVDRDNILLYLYNSSHTNFCRGGSVFFFGGEALVFLLSFLAGGRPKETFC